MDLSNYVSILLKQHGHLNVPGLGYFVHLRKHSYYEKETGTLYPPHYETTFDPYHTDSEDETLLNFISEKRAISRASAQYFLDKYVGTVRERAELNELEFADLGSFYIDDNSQLIFRPAKTANTHNSTLYGLPPVSIQKLADIGEPVQSREEFNQSAKNVKALVKENFSDEGPVKIEQQPLPVAETPATVKETVVPQIPHRNQFPEFKEEDEEEYVEPKSNLKYWITGVVIVILAIAGVLAYCQYNGLINLAKTPVTTPAVVHQAPVPSTVVKMDSDTTAEKQDSIPPQSTAPATAPDSANKTAATGPITDIPKNTWIIAGGQYANFENANRTLSIYRKLGYPQARLLDSIPKKEYFIYKIIFGYRYTQKDAEAARTEILKPRKLKPQFITVQPYK